jgi:hypothetical protein
MAESDMSDRGRERVRPANRALGYGEAISQSERLRDTKFSAAFNRYLSREQILLVEDCDAEVFGVGVGRQRASLVAVMTPERLALLRGSGRRGPKEPWTALLEEIGKLTVTHDGDLAIDFANTRGKASFWKLLLRNRVTADEWMSTIDAACWLSAPGKDGLG